MAIQCKKIIRRNICLAIVGFAINNAYILSNNMEKRDDGRSVCLENK